MSFPNLKENVILKIKIGDNWEGRLGAIFSRGSPGSGTRAGKCYLDDDGDVELGVAVPRGTDRILQFRPLRAFPSSQFFPRDLHGAGGQGL